MSDFDVVDQFAISARIGGNKHTIPFRRQRLDIDEMLPESSSSHRLHAQQLPYVNDPYIIDIVKVTEDRVADLEMQLQEHKRHADELETNMLNLKYQVRGDVCRRRWRRRSARWQRQRESQFGEDCP